MTAKGADYGSLTTPDPLSLHASLEQLAQEGITHLAMEASSHGLDQHRLDGVRLRAGAFLNLGHDHLDYHPSVEAYFAAKMRLWQLLPQGAPVVINRDEPYAEQAAAAAAAAGHPLIGIGRKGETMTLLRSCAAGLLAAADRCAWPGAELGGDAAAGRRFHGRQCARRGGARHRDGRGCRGCDRRRSPG